MEWLSVQGTSIVGFGILRLVPHASGPTRFRIRYADSPDGYAVTDNAQLFVLPGDAFAQRDVVYGHDLLRFAFEPGKDPDTPPAAKSRDAYGYGSDTYTPTLSLEVTLDVADESTYLVAYGPWTDPDTGRPAGDRHTFELQVEPLPGAGGALGQYAWIESEAGELITSNWTHRPMLARGRPVPADAFGEAPAVPELYFEIRPLILYDARLVRAAGEPLDTGMAGVPTPKQLRAAAVQLEAAGAADLAADRRERAADLEALARRRDRRIVMTPELAEKFRRVPIRWR